MFDGYILHCIRGDDVHHLACPSVALAAVTLATSEQIITQLIGYSFINMWMTIPIMYSILPFLIYMGKTTVGVAKPKINLEEPTQ